MFNQVRFVFVCLIGVFLVNLTVGTNLVEGASRNRNRSRDNFVKKAKVKVEAGNYSSARIDMMSAITLDPRNEENLYFAALIDYKLGKTASAIMQCDKILKNNRARRYRTKALKLKRLAQDNVNTGTSIGRVLRGSSTTMLYSTAMNNQKQFVDSGYNNVVRRVQQAKKRSLSPVAHRRIAKSSAYDVLTGREVLKVKPVDMRLARATPIESALDKPLSDTITDNTDTSPTGTSLSNESTEPVDTDSGDDVTFTDFDIDSGTDKNTSTEHMKPIEAEAIKPGLEAEDSSGSDAGFGNFGDDEKTETPVKTAVTPPTKTPEKTPASGDSDDGFGDFGDDDKEEPPAKPTKAPAKIEVSDDSDDGFGDFGADDKEETPAKPTKAPAKSEASDDSDDGFGDFGDDDEQKTPAKPTKAPAKEDKDSEMDGFGDFGDESSEEKEKAESKDDASEGFGDFGDDDSSDSGEDADDFGGFDSF